MSRVNGYEWYQPSKEIIQPTKYVWKNRIVRDGLSMVVGNEEVGKGFFAVWFMSRLTRGALPGVYQQKPINVEIVAYEDSEAEWAKRMDAADATQGRWGMFRSEHIPDFREDLEQLVVHWRKHKIKFVYFDQLQDHLGLKTDNYNGKEVRNALMPLQKALTDAHVTGLATLHPNKRGESARERVPGAGAFAVVRSAMYLARHPDDDETRVLFQIKNSRGPKMGALEFEIVDTPRDYRPNGRYIRTGILDEFRVSGLALEDVLGSERKSAKAELDRRLKDYLVDGKWHFYSDIVQDCGLQEFNFNVLQRCCIRIGAEKRKVGYPARSQWRVPRV
jgi:hypothetical protein